MSVGGGGEQRTETINPVYRETPESAFSWMRPGQDVMNEMGRGATESMSYNFGQKNLFGSGMQQEATMKELIRQILGKTQLVNRGQWMNPSTKTETTQYPGIGIG